MVCSTPGLFHGGQNECLRIKIETFEGSNKNQKADK